MLWVPTALGSASFKKNQLYASCMKYFPNEPLVVVSDLEWIGLLSFAVFPFEFMWLMSLPFFCSCFGVSAGRDLAKQGLL